MPSTQPSGACCLRLSAAVTPPENARVGRWLCVPTATQNGVGNTKVAPMLVEEEEGGPENFLRSWGRDRRGTYAPTATRMEDAHLAQVPRTPPRCRIKNTLHRNPQSTASARSARGGLGADGYGNLPSLRPRPPGGSPAPRVHPGAAAAPACFRVLGTHRLPGPHIHTRWVFLQLCKWPEPSSQLQRQNTGEAALGQCTGSCRECTQRTSVG